MNERAERPSGLDICGIGASAGGLEALKEFFQALSGDLGVAYVVIVHLAPDRRSELAEILSRWTSMPVQQVGDRGARALEANHVYVIPPDRKLELSDHSIGASPFEQPRGQRAAIDLFFRSLATGDGDRFAVLLSGAGADGAIGARAVKEHGGVILVQDPAEAAHDSMPRAVIATGVADLVLPVRDLAIRLGELVRHKREMRVAAADTSTAALSPGDGKALKTALSVLHKRTGHNFGQYKRTTVLRRVARRMQLTGHATIQDYVKFLRTSTTESQALLNDLLISVTTFFRDPDAWEALAEQVIAPLVTDTDADTPLRVWVVGCATGEEAYTVTILLQEAFAQHQRVPDFTVFATDLDEPALAVAREGLYPHAIAADVSESRLQRFFRPEGNHYRIVPEIRDRLVFAAHNLLRDPPFSRVHLISCRNLLIYLERELQEQVMGIFRYACRDEGALFLGASESASESDFRAIDKRHRIFRTRHGRTHRDLPDLLSVPTPRAWTPREAAPSVRPSTTELHVSALEHMAPPSVLVDERGNVAHVSATAARFFQQGGGALAKRLTELVRPELRDELHTLLQHTADDQAAHLSRFVPVRFDGAPHLVAMVAQQRQTPDGRRDLLVTFLDGGVAREDTPAGEPEPSDELVRTLQQRLRAADQRIEGMREEHHQTMEDLRAANEELQSLNEEYRSTTEELETSKEELQSINEELHTVNYELKTTLEEISRAHGDLENLMSATNVPTLFLTRDLRIKRFTPQLGEIFKIRARDVDRPITDLTHALDYDLEEDARQVLASGATLSRDVESTDRQSYVVSVSPYRKHGAKDIDGIVATFVDVSEVKQAEQALRESETRLETELYVMRRLHEMVIKVAAATDLRGALDYVLGTAVGLHGADFGNIQLLDETSQQLRIAVHMGFAAPFLARFALVDRHDDSACGRALRSRQAVQIGDVRTDPDYAPFQAVAAEAGYRAVQSTPLIGTTGDVLGVLSVHFRAVHQFTERDRQLADLLGNTAAGLIEGRSQQEQLRTLNETLRQRTTALEAIQDQLSHQASELQSQNIHREQFLASLGHELRNPLAAIQGSLALMNAAQEFSPKALAILRRQADHMTHLVNDLLDVTRVRHGQIRLDRMPVDVQEAVASAIAAVRPGAAGKSLTLTSDVEDGPLLVEADPERFAQILDNLLRNAVNYTDEGTISVTARRERSFARIAVRDTGVGIAPEAQARVFEPYTRAGGRRGGDEGLGLGLSVVKALTEAHGGSVTCHSDGVGSGSEFSVTLPLATQPLSHAAPEPVQRPRPRRVLVVDDQHDVADMLASLLETLGQDVAVAYDAASAMSRARDHRPDVAFIDVAMPGTSGAALSADLRREFSHGLRLVAVTGHDKDHPLVRQGQFDHHLLKPVTLNNVVAVLNEGVD